MSLKGLQQLGLAQPVPVTLYFGFILTETSSFSSSPKRIRYLHLMASTHWTDSLQRSEKHIRLSLCGSTGKARI